MIERTESMGIGYCKVLRVLYDVKMLFIPLNARRLVYRFGAQIDNIGYGLLPTESAYSSSLLDPYLSESDSLLSVPTIYSAESDSLLSVSPSVVSESSELPASS